MELYKIVPYDKLLKETAKQYNKNKSDKHLQFLDYLLKNKNNGSFFNKEANVNWLNGLIPSFMVIRDDTSDCTERMIGDQKIQCNKKSDFVKFDDFHDTDEESLEFEQMDFDEKRDDKQLSVNKKISPNYFEKQKILHTEGGSSCIQQT